jgi:crotonobetainyl-CoA:carnitine CoA-transferase CaiB-like acyl-CoA transferase
VGALYNPPPLLGEHSEAILFSNMLGYSKEMIDNLKEKKVI